MPNGKTGGAIRQSHPPLVTPRSAARRGTAPWAQAPSGNGEAGGCQSEPPRVKPRSAARGGTAPWAQAPSGNGGDGIRQSEPLGGEAAFSGKRGHSPLGASAERKKWRWYTEVRTTTLFPEEAEQADGCPATSLVVNLNPGAARFESTEKWRWGESNPRPRSLEKSSLHV